MLPTSGAQLIEESKLLNQEVLIVRRRRRNRLRDKGDRLALWVDHRFANGRGKRVRCGKEFGSDVRHAKS